MKDVQNPLYRYKKLIFIFIIILLTVFVMISNRKDFSCALHEMFNTRFDSIAILTILVILQLVLDNNILYFAIDDPSLTYTKATTINLAGCFFSGITPLYIGSYPSRVYYLYKEAVPIDKTLSALTVKGFTYQIVIAILMILGLFMGGLEIIKDGGYLVFLIIGFIYNMVLTVILVAISSSKRINDWVIKIIKKFTGKSENFNKRKEELMKSIANYYSNTQRMYQDRKYFINVFSNTLLKVIVMYAMPIAVFFGLGIDIYSSWQEIFALSSIMAIIVSVIPTPGGVAASEAVFLLFFGLLFVGQETKVDAGLLIWRLFSYYLIIILGLIATLFLQAKEPAYRRKEKK